MKPQCERGREARRTLLHTRCFFQSGIESWHAGWSSGDENDGFRNFRNLNREYRSEATRKRAAEMAVFVLMLLAAAWPVIYMIISVVKLLLKGRPLDQ